MIRAIASKNCRSAHSRIQKECAILNGYNGNSMYYVPYGTVQLPEDSNMYSGEIIFEWVAIGTRSIDQTPLVQSCLNGLIVPKSETDPISYLNKRIRVVGFSIADALWNAQTPAHSDDPVAVLAGYMSIRNTGPHIIRAGDLVMWQFPALDRKEQLPLDRFATMSRSRRVLETVPFTSTASKASVIDDSSIKTIIASKLCVTLTDYITQHMLKAALNGITDAATITLITQNLTNVKNKMFDADENTGFKLLIPISTLIVSQFSSKIMAVAQSDGIPGQLFDIVGTPTSSSMLNRHF